MGIPRIVLRNDNTTGYRVRVREELMKPPSDFNKGIRQPKLLDIFSNVQFLVGFQS